MKTYSKIVITTLPPVFFLLLATVGTTFYFSRTALTRLAETWLDTRLSEAMKTAADQENMLHQYGLETIPASVAKAKLDAARLMSAIEVGKAGFIFAVDAKGIITVYPDASMIGRNVSREPWFHALKAPRERLVYRTPQGANLTLAEYFKPWKWYILASDPEREVYGVVNRMKPYLIGIAILGFTVMAAVLMLLTRRLTDPLRLLTIGADRIGKGDLDTRISIRSQDEFGRLARVFNQMTRQLRKTLAALQHREAHFRSLIENASDLITILDAEGRTSYLSPSIERILGYTSDAVMGQPVFDYIHPEDLDRAVAAFERHLRFEPVELPTQLRFRHRDGSWITLETTSNNLLDDPAVGGLVINARDITKRKEAEAALQRSYQELEDRVAGRTAELFKANVQLRQEIKERERMSREKEKLQNQLLQAQKMEAIGTLAGGIAHDFNNLLMGIQGNVDMMGLDRETARAHATRLETIRDCVASGARLTRQLLGFARMGKYEVQMTDPNHLVNKCADMFARTRKELRIVSRYQKDVWAVSVDRGQIEQVLLNIFINAWQAMPSGGDIYLETANRTLDEHRGAAHHVGAGKYVQITVADTGNGMEKTTLERIFDPFFTTKAMKRGTGMGLASAYGIISNHGGFIDVSSEIGRGTTFDIYLKAVDHSVAATAAGPQSPREGHETVLLVDDDALIVDVGQAMLRALGYDVLTAASGEAAIAIYRDRGERIDLVILDMIMPDMGGGRVYDILKEMDPDIKVLLSSGYSINGQAGDILNRGCNGFIQKPFDLQVMSEKVRDILDGAD
jgi:two-component system, cell cycle sensor histidine kinase and response regulator CckA